MKRQDKKLVEKMRSALHLESQHLEVPKMLDPKEITEQLKYANGTYNRRKASLRSWHAFGMAASLVILIVGVGLVLGSDTLFNKAPPETPYHADEHRMSDSNVLAADSYDDVNTYFSKLYESQKNGFWNDLLDGFGKGTDTGVAEEIAGTADGDASVTMPSATTSNSENTGSNAEVGTTNSQVANVEEADIVKNNGTHLFAAYNFYPDTGVDYVAQVNIFKMLDGGKLEKSAVIAIDKGSDYDNREEVKELFFYKELLIILTEKSAYTRTEKAGNTYYHYSAKTGYRVYDISNPAKPTLVTSFSQDGHYLSARLFNGKLCLISTHDVSQYVAKDADTETLVPHITKGSTSAAFAPAELYIDVNSTSSSYLVVTTSDMEAPKNEPKKTAVLGAGTTVYCSGENLYVAANTQRGATGETLDMAVISSAGNTTIYKFTLGDNPAYAGSAQAEGTLINQFAMDEHNGHLRVATTIATTWTHDPATGELLNQKPSSSRITIFDSSLKQVGIVKNIAPSESIQSVRFMGDTGYLVTFEQVDPLFMVDLTDPTSPKILGELKIPGFSSYLHPIGDGKLIGIGTPGTKSGTVPGVKISLFDATDPTSPKETDNIELLYPVVSWSSEHKSIVHYAKKQLLFIPVERTEGAGGYYDTRYIAVSYANGKLELAKTYLSSTNKTESQAFWSNMTARCTYVDSTLYTFIGSAVASYNIDTGEKLFSMTVTPAK